MVKEKKSQLVNNKKANVGGGTLFETSHEERRAMEALKMVHQASSLVHHLQKYISALQMFLPINLDCF